jgi:hypothetical protein
MMCWSRSTPPANPLDLKIRSGALKLVLPYRLPLILGNDLAGVVVRVGARVRRFKPGDEVYARPAQERIGAFAECIAVREDALALKPKTLNMEDAASHPAGRLDWLAGAGREGEPVLGASDRWWTGSFPFQPRRMRLITLRRAGPKARLLSK